MHRQSGPSGPLVPPKPQRDRPRHFRKDMLCDVMQHGGPNPELLRETIGAACARVVFMPSLLASSRNRESRPIRPRDGPNHSMTATLGYAAADAVHKCRMARRTARHPLMKRQPGPRGDPRHPVLAAGRSAGGHTDPHQVVSPPSVGELDRLCHHRLWVRHQPPVGPDLRPGEHRFRGLRVRVQRCLRSAGLPWPQGYVVGRDMLAQTPMW
jgi:hypothetical protein